jgi:hypothetical protein
MQTIKYINKSFAIPDGTHRFHEVSRLTERDCVVVGGMFAIELCYFG